jgi:hypothetical protein
VHMRTAYRTRRAQIPTNGLTGLGVTPKVQGRCRSWMRKRGHEREGEDVFSMGAGIHEAPGWAEKT